jgi:hypothetical protein
MRILQETTFRNLRVLDLTQFTVTENALIQFLESLDDQQLSRLYFERMRLVDGTWLPIFRLLTNFRRLDHILLRMLLQPLVDDLFPTVNDRGSLFGPPLRNPRSELGAKCQNGADIRAYLVRLANGYRLGPELGIRNHLVHYGYVLFEPADGVVIF